MRKFIWTKDEKYQNTFYTTFCDKEGYNFGVFEFNKKHIFDKKIKNVAMKIFADTRYALRINGRDIGMGPAYPGGDWALKKPMPVQYYDSYFVNCESSELDVYVQVRLSPVDLCDVSCGRGGLWAEYEVEFESGEKQTFAADESWLCRRDTRFAAPKQIDFTAKEEIWENAVWVESVWNVEQSPLLALEEWRIDPCFDGNKAIFDKIYAGYICVETEGDGKMRLAIGETPNKRHSVYEMSGAGKIRIPILESVGEIDAELSEGMRLKELYIMASHYPIANKGEFRCSDQKLNRIYNLGIHTTDICRQQIELDSPVHKETLGCPGDYMIESLISYLAFGEYTLSAFDITRIANYLRTTQGRMFHTSYSLMWIYMMYDYVMFSGDMELIRNNMDVVGMLLERFECYEADGIVEKAPDYMFIDWVMVDGFTLHHPPKVLGQTALTALYYRALNVSAKLYNLVGETEKSSGLCEKAEVVKRAFNKAFYDDEKGLYISGLTTPGIVGKWQPENVDKVYFTRQANILAVYCGLCDNGAQVMEKVITDKEMPTIQPYFMHFEFEALYACGLFGKYGISEMYRWNTIVDECDKGMKEGWGDGCGEYNYDYSHAWGSSPSYQLPSKIAGLEILKPGFEEISLSPNLFGLESAEMVIPTPRGNIEIKLGDKTELKIPDGIKIKDA